MIFVFFLTTNYLILIKNDPILIIISLIIKIIEPFSSLLIVWADLVQIRAIRFEWSGEVGLVFWVMVVFFHLFTHFIFSVGVHESSISFACPKETLRLCSG